MNTKQTPDTAPGPYYVSVMRDSNPDHYRLLSGPYPTHSQALGLVDRALRIAQYVDAKSIWYSFGTVRMSSEVARPGILQQLGYNLLLERLENQIKKSSDS